ncbi:unnamed protein product [Closterium sp. NIES-64]|nr:unnamed protein product [Closterium sp. NIES-64]
MVYELEPASASNFAEPASEPWSGQQQQGQHSGVQVRVGPGLVKEATEAADGELGDAGSNPGFATPSVSPTLRTPHYRTVTAPIHAAPRADISTQGVSSDGIEDIERSEEGVGSEESEGIGEGGESEEREEDDEHAERDGSEEGDGSEEEDASGITAKAQTVSDAAEETGPVPIAAGAGAGAGAGTGEGAGAGAGAGAGEGEGAGAGEGAAAGAGAGAGAGAEPERAKKVSVDTLEEARIILKGIDGGEDGTRVQMKRVQATDAAVTTQGHGSGAGGAGNGAGAAGGSGEGMGEEGGVDWSHGLKATSMYVVKDGDTCEGLAYSFFRGSLAMMRNLNHGFECSDAALTPNMQLFVP